MRPLTIFRISVAALGLFLASASVWAAAISGAVTGGTAKTNDGTYVLLSVPWGGASTPVNTVGDNNFNTWNLNAFDEVQNYTLTSPLVTTTGTIAAGTVIDSQYVFFDPAGRGGRLIGDVQFNGDVLGIITTKDGLEDTNKLLGDAGVDYQDSNDVGLEPRDSVTIDPSNQEEIEWDTSASNPGDSVRVITAGDPPPVPEPGSTLLMGSGFASLLLLFGRRRKKTTR
jgi:hypothetical protein